jgi:hypothetical protein
MIESEYESQDPDQQVKVYNGMDENIVSFATLPIAVRLSFCVLEKLESYGFPSP